MRAFTVRQNEPEFGYKPVLYIEVNGKRQSLPPLLNVQAGDVIVVIEKEGQGVALRLTPPQERVWKQVCLDDVKEECMNDVKPGPHRLPKAVAAPKPLPTSFLALSMMASAAQLARPPGENAGGRGRYAGPVRSKVLQIGRNDPCHCGSGKKFKKCCQNGS